VATTELFLKGKKEIIKGDMTRDEYPIGWNMKTTIAFLCLGVALKYTWNSVLIYVHCKTEYMGSKDTQ
jgi:hypothetical protein